MQFNVAEIKVTDRVGNIVFTKVWHTEDLRSAADKFSKKYPNHWVTIKSEGRRTISLEPYNMQLDQAKLDSGTMTVGAFVTKWFGKAPTKRMVKKELEEEFGEDQVI